MEITSSIPQSALWWKPKELLKEFRQDPRWPVALILFTYLVLGITVLGFNRSPAQIVITTVAAAAMELLFSKVFKGHFTFPLSAIITSFGLSLLLNYSHSYAVVLLPVFFAIGSKYIFTVNGRHLYNPGLFGVVASLLLTESLITASPAYQWNGIGSMSLFIVMPAVLLFMPKIQRSAIVITFLIVFTAQTALRAWIMKHHLPFETLFFGTLSSPPFFLFVFFMITDPATSPPTVRGQIFAGAMIALLDLAFHLMQSYFTFFYAAFLFATCKALYAHFQLVRKESPRIYFRKRILNTNYLSRLCILLPTTWILCAAILPHPELIAAKYDADFFLEQIPPETSGIHTKLGDLYEQVDPRIQHVIKWIFSVGDATSIADFDNDGLDDVFFTLVLKKQENRASLYRNTGDFHFERVPIPALDPYLENPKVSGVVTNAIFNDYDNDGDKDLFLTVAFGHPILLQNQLKETGQAEWMDVSREAGLTDLYTNSISASFADFNKDGHLDLLIGNVLPEYLPDYSPRKRLNLFSLPDPEYPGDRRMFNFMHHSWHEADNGGKNLLLFSNGQGRFERVDSDAIGLSDTRWTLAIGISDFNNDGWPDIYFANDFGADNLFLNRSGQSFQKVLGPIFGSIGRDTYKGMNVSVADFDQNSFNDIYISNVHHHLQAEGSMLWLLSANPDSKFVPRIEDKATYLGALNERRFGWGAAAVDLDLNGWPDLFQANGMVDDTIDHRFETCPDYWYVNEKIARSPPSLHTYADKWGDIRGMCIYGHERNRVYLNRGAKAKPQFIDVAPLVGVTQKLTSRGVASGDFNNDGRPDITVSHMFHNPTLYVNKSRGDTANWLSLRLVGDPARGCTKEAVGSKVELAYKSNGKPFVQYHETQIVSGLLGQSSLVKIFGLGKGRIEDLKMSVSWCYGEKVSYDMSPFIGKNTILYQDANLNSL